MSVSAAVAAPPQLFTYSWTNFAGQPGGVGNADGPGINARFNQPGGAAMDASGNIYVADTCNNLIRKITPAGVVTTLAGQAGITGSADGTGTAASFNQPRAVAADANGNVYVADTTNCTVRKITSAGVVTTLAGKAGVWGYIDGTGRVARFDYPMGIAVGADGNVYVADTYNCLIRKIISTGEVSTLAGSFATAGSTDGSGSAALFNNPWGLAADGAGNLFVADSSNETIRMVTPGGTVTTVAGSAGSTGNTDGTGSVALFNNPEGVAVDSQDNVYVTDTNNNTVRRITSAGVVTTLAGSASSGNADGAGGNAQFNNPQGVVVDSHGNLFVADTGNNTIRSVTGVGMVTLFAGSNAASGSADGTGSAARFNGPGGVAVSAGGNIYVADSSNHTVRKITAAGVVTTLAGSAGNEGYLDGTGSAALFFFFTGVAVDANDNVYVADTYNYAIRKITSAGVVTTLAGQYSSGYVDGTGSAARFDAPTSLAVDGNGNVYVADTGNNVIRKISSAGVVTTLAGQPGVWGHADGPGSAAQFSSPNGVAVDAAGNVYVADTNNCVIRKVTSEGVVTTLAGGESPGTADGVGSAARFSYPTGIAVDGHGTVFVSDGRQTIRRITSDGNVTTIAGLPDVIGGADGVGNAAEFYRPCFIAAASNGNLFVADTANNRVAQGTPSSSPPIVSLPPVDNLFATTATLEGTVNPNGLATTAEFDYGATPNYGSTLSIALTPDSDTAVHTVSVALSGLTPDTTYYYRLTATNANGNPAVVGTFHTPTPQTMALEEPAGTGLVDGYSPLDFGTEDLGHAQSLAFTVRNIGSIPLTNIACSFDGADPTDFTASALGATTLAPGSTITFTVTFNPTGSGSRSAALHVSSSNGNAFDVPLTGVCTGTMAATYLTGQEVPVAVNTLNAAGSTVNLTLGYVPAPGTNLVVVKNSGANFISGAFTNLVQGQTVILSYGGRNYSFIVNYYGGDGNDLVLQWASTRLLAWGLGGDGELGNGNPGNSAVPTPVGNSPGILLGGKTVLSVAAGGYHTLALCSDGTLATWGSNYAGELGVSNFGAFGGGVVFNPGIAFSLSPLAVPVSAVLSGRRPIQVAAGSEFNLVLCSDGTLVAWGDNSHGQAGNSNLGSSWTPTVVDVDPLDGSALAGKSIVAIAAGYDHSLALCSDGTVAAWGSNSDGQLGNGSTTDSAVPVAVNAAPGSALAGRTVVAISAGAYHNLALCSDGTVVAWGRGTEGQLGDGNSSSSNTPVAVNTTGLLSGKQVSAISAGFEHSLALCMDGTVSAWGDNSNGGLGNTNTATNSGLPVAVNSGALSIRMATHISAGYLQNLVLCTDGTLIAWGTDADGELGDNGGTQTGIPVVVSTSTLQTGESWSSAATGATATHSLAFTAGPIYDSSLSSLALSSGALTPAFASGTLSYGANVSVSPITVIPALTDSGATVQVNGSTVASGTASSPISLAMGLNTIDVVVIAQNGYTKSTYALRVTRNDLVVTTQRGSQTELNGQPAIFSVSATGTPYLSSKGAYYLYQWYMNGVPIPGATSATYSIGNTSPYSAGNYWVVVTNPYGSLTSSTYTLTVSQPVPVMPREGYAVMGILLVAVVAYFLPRKPSELRR